MDTKLDKVTTQYIEFEDRVRVLGITDNNQTHEIWITRRLLDRLVIALLSSLEKQRPNRAKNDIHMAFDQEIAVTNYMPETPVTASKEVSSWLADSVDITSNKNGVVLHFKKKNLYKAELPFEFEPLRQWLFILYKTYQHSEWPLNPWPEWFLKSEDNHIKPTQIYH